MPKLINHIYDPIFRQNYYCVVCPKWVTFKDAMKREAGVDVGDKQGTEGYFGAYANNGIELYVIWCKSRDAGIVAHEVLHAVSYGLRKRDIPLSDDTEDVYAYLTQFLVNGIMNRRAK